MVGSPKAFAIAMRCGYFKAYSAALDSKCSSIAPPAPDAAPKTVGAAIRPAGIAPTAAPCKVCLRRCKSIGAWSVSGLFRHLFSADWVRVNPRWPIAELRIGGDVFVLRIVLEELPLPCSD